MALTLGNNLTNTVTREINYSIEEARTFSKSLSIGNNASLHPVNVFIGNSLSDKNIILKSNFKNNSYTFNILATADEYLQQISLVIQDSLKLIELANSLSSNKKIVLQKNFTDNKKQINFLINAAVFDGRKILAGDCSNIEFNKSLYIRDISEGKLFRSSIAVSINEWFAQDHNRCRYYNHQEEINNDLTNNLSLLHVARHRAGSGTGGMLTNMNVVNAIVNLCDGNYRFISSLSQLLPETLAALKALVPLDESRNFTNATVVQILATIPAPVRQELLKLTDDNVPIYIASSRSNIQRLLAKDVYTTALKTIRAEQVSIANQKSNILAITEVLRAATNITKQAADSYLKTDYVLTAQEYAETIRHLIAAITVLQAGNRIADAAQRLIDDLAK